jgi:acetyl-CoA carboxylase biotin carboxyl carrier protein
MNLTQIQDLIKFVARSGVNEVEIEQKDFKIIIKSDNENKRRGRGKVEEQYIQVPMQAMPQAAPVAAVAPAPAPVPTTPPAAAAPVEDTSKLITIKSPMIGTFYRSPSPDKPLFKEVGDMLKVGDVVCIIEAMKLFNEIESEVSGKIVKVLVDDSTPVEYDQPLFLVDPS